MSNIEQFPADAITLKPVSEVTETQTQYVRERELGRFATGPVWVPSQLDIDYFNRSEKGE